MYYGNGTNRIFLKGVIFMMAKLFTINIIDGTVKFDEVPRLLKQQVADNLVAAGMPELVTDSSYLPK